jgi:hypothetical protein
VGARFSLQTERLRASTAAQIIIRESLPFVAHELSSQQSSQVSHSSGRVIRPIPYGVVFVVAIFLHVVPTLDPFQ